MTIYEELRNEYGLIMTVDNVACVLHQHPVHVRNLCRNGNLPAVKIESRWFISTSKFAAMIDGGDSHDEA